AGGSATTSFSRLLRTVKLRGIVLVSLVRTATAQGSYASAPSLIERVGGGRAAPDFSRFRSPYSACGVRKSGFSRCEAVFAYQSAEPISALDMVWSRRADSPERRLLR